MIHLIMIAIYLILGSDAFNSRVGLNMARRSGDSSSRSALRVSYKVNIISKEDGKTVEQTVEMDESMTILDALRAEDIDAPFFRVRLDYAQSVRC